MATRSEHFNEDRATWAHAALRSFQWETGSDFTDALADLMADLMHWCDRYGFEFNDELERAREHYATERIEDGPPCVPRPRPDDKPPLKPSKDVTAALARSLAQALRYIEVRMAYTGAMTAAEVEAQIVKNATISRVEIGANSANTLAAFELFEARAALAAYKVEP